ncbi:putative CxxxxCH...CXXCH cytochrome family protein [Geobacter argillaceus]|uniref:Putative CxxxxCH...CXXCH cytochrome family protein n=2 Tax=Geobacter argillaceus TaxID=345631 RepID=A0A562WQB6_9BACT|nr:putative CxxxxCH...CXXCH cytochrome family protein [Geobacter argillaceus]
MGKTFTKTIRGMNLWAKVALIVLFTFALSVFMYEGWYRPLQVQAATVTYQASVPDTTTGLGADGICNATSGAPNNVTANLKDTIATTYTTSASRYYPTTGLVNGTTTSIAKFYGPVYTSNTAITAPSASVAIRGYNATDQWTFHLYEYDPAGTAGNKRLLATSSTITSGTGSTVAASPTYVLNANNVVASGHRLMMEIIYRPGGTTLTPRVYLDGTSSTSWTRLTVTETVAIDTTAPTVTAFTMPSTATSTTVNVSSFTATDAVGVTGYMITESATAPAAGDAGWNATAPTTFTFAGTGARTAYAWAKDAAGNVSTSLSASVTITLPDTTAPTVTAFTMPATATSTTVSVTSFTASDAVGVTGYMITESAAAPAAGDPGWNATAPTSFTFAGTGARTAYAWAKDAAGNISASRSASVTITVVNGTTASALTFSGVTYNTIVVTAPFTGDANGNNSCVIKWGTVNGTYPNTATSTKSGNSYVATVSGLSATTSYYFQATFTDVDGVTGSPVTGAQTTAIYTSPLMHASANLGTKYGTWGTAFDCTTCHAATTANVKQVADIITTPNGPRQVVFTRMTASVISSMGVLGNDQRTDLARSTNVCEVCHHKTTYHQYSSIKVGVDKTHNNRTDCVTCHAHAKGFAASCASCHAGDGGPVTTSPTTNALGGATGAHAKHTGVAPAGLAMKCGGCHDAYTTNPMGDNRIEIGFNINATNFPNGFNGTVTGGSFVGTNTLSTPYIWRGTGTTTFSTSAAKDVTCSVYCHGGWTNSGGTTPSWVSVTALTCGSCHFTSTNPPAAAGDHAVHLGLTGTLALTCANCHPSGSYTNQHLNGNVEWSLSGAKYNATSKYKNALTGSTNSVAPSASYGSCATTNCHGQLSPTWGGTVGTTGQCQKCHGSQSVAFATVTSAQVAPGTGNIDTGRVTGVTVRGGMHQEHLQGTAGISEPVKCSECHVKVNAITDATHMNYSTATITFSGTATAASHAPTVSRVSGVINCNNTYCHTANRPTGTGAGQSGINNPPVWNNSALIGGTSIADTCTGKCHNMPPGGAIAGDNHAGLTASGTYTTPASLAACSSNSPATGCHPTINAAPTSMLTIFFNKLLHINGKVEGGTCVGCHSKVITRTKGRPGTTLANVVAEMNTAGNWSHKRSGAYAVTDEDCCVCHLEGSSVDHKPTAYHQDGNIDLRDPKGLTPEAPITNISGGAFTFQRFSTSYAAGSRTSTGHLSNNIDNVITQKFCLACHSATGATNSGAWVTGGTQYKPFNTTISGAGYVTPLSAGVAGGVVDVDSMLATTNSTFHPVKGPRTNSYAANSRMNAPYGVTKTNGTPSNGVVINCFDCHNAPTPLTRRTVTAHGASAANAFRGTYYTTTATLCHTCHAGYSALSGGMGHGSGSAFYSSVDSGMDTYMSNQCQKCHASTDTAVRPVRAEDAHGFSYFAGSGTDKMWPRGATETYKMYAFIRNTNQWTGTLTWKPLSGPSVPAGSATCGGNMTSSTCGDSMTAYTPGGAY